MNRTRWILALSLGLALAMNCFATPHVFMGFDEVTQRMFAVVRGDAGDPDIYAYCTLDQSNPGGWIGDYPAFSPADPEAIFETPMSPDDPDRLTDIPAGELNFITALVELYDEQGNFLFTIEAHDTLASDSIDGILQYAYTQEGCNWDVPDTIRINTAYCATICHGARSIPIYCEDPNYNPDLLEVTVTNGCLASETHCNNPDCTPVDWSLFSWRKRVFPGCQLYLSLTYCGEGPGCVCIWRSDFILPVEMNGFAAVAGDGQVTLNWSTASESDLSQFRVSRSTVRDDGYTFVGHVDATNSATGHSYSFVDDHVQNGTHYFYKLHIEDANGALHVYNLGNSPVIAEATPGVGLATEYALTQNYPNPFNSQTSFSFSLANDNRVTLKVFDLLGREVATVVDKNMTAGPHSVNWSAEGLATGVYVYTLTSGEFSDSKKLLFLK